MNTKEGKFLWQVEQLRVVAFEGIFMSENVILLLNIQKVEMSIMNKK